MDRLEYKAYYGSIEYENGRLHGKVLGMTKDVILYEGNTVEELENDFETAIESYFESCEEMGITPRKSYNGTLNIRIPCEMHCKLAIMAEENNTTISSVIRDSIEKTLELYLDFPNNHQFKTRL
ncbi:MAG: type II toxin-antitoxin system HicB family antitoxin [Prevotellaceae bacterium]|jgi:predicted HicB family RNase H-like nuclease|nr:type II toxin-antitoxin system HicB family antitoxin [Prevotellaceae bacterium]